MRLKANNGKSFLLCQGRARAHARAVFLPLSDITGTPGEQTGRQPKKGLTSGHRDTSQGSWADFAVPSRPEFTAQTRPQGLGAHGWQALCVGPAEPALSANGASPCVSTIHTWGPSERESISRGPKTGDPEPGAT